MKSISFPDMFNSSSTNVVSGKEATASNLRLLLQSEKGDLFGDPYYGVNVKKYLFEQNNHVLRDIVIDDIYTALILFMPQLIVKRSDIVVVTNNKTTLVANLKVTNRSNYVTDLYSIILFQEE
jgi:phage baseplate assembly protein W